MKARKATKKDAAGVAKVLIDAYNIDTLKEGKEAFLTWLDENQEFIVVEDAGEIAGIASWTIHDLPKHELAELNKIAVLKKFKGKGHARTLFEEIVKEIKKFYKSKGFNLRKLYLLTHKSNGRARHFYEKLGFIYETELVDHYYHGENECVYSVFFR
ncbi:MAG: GNAT family N-acetyltransferase [Candidatus Woesearchaeota archaeon]|jgi:ribosomal protein S18 acetylase RimI-like enzyme|nr:GNAT family N-acetyltransferase [Candidatus Woesearchaeota archaeon]MDP7323677.1 GNAT family N-acetyltransferase [Candidatus Woesearchaeota archaeon]